MAVLTVETLTTHFFTKAGVVKAVDDVSFAVDAGKVLGLVGESGSGKSVTALSLMGLVDPPGRVGIAAPDKRLCAYPHQLSGGMRQRVAIAIALLNNPRVIIADEPTTALDVTIQAQILFEVQKLARETGTALIWITHDLSVIAGLADQVCVMYAGRIVESGPTAELLDRPLHPYPGGLTPPTRSRNERGKPLNQIPGMTPSLANLEPGCAFRERCARATDACVVAPDISRPSASRTLRCFNPCAGMTNY